LKAIHYSAANEQIACTSTTLVPQSRHADKLEYLNVIARGYSVVGMSYDSVQIIGTGAAIIARYLNFLRMVDTKFYLPKNLTIAGDEKTVVPMGWKVAKQDYENFGKYSLCIHLHFLGGKEPEHHFIRGIEEVIRRCKRIHKMKKDVTWIFPHAFCPLHVHEAVEAILNRFFPHVQCFTAQDRCNPIYYWMCNTSKLVVDWKQDFGSPYKMRQDQCFSILRAMEEHDYGMLSGARIFKDRLNKFKMLPQWIACVMLDALDTHPRRRIGTMDPPSALLENASIKFLLDLRAEVRRQNRIYIPDKNDPLLLELPIVEAQKERECSICLEQMDVRTGHRLHCGHVFHYGCIYAWFDLETTCPYCREEISLLEYKLD